jgi:glycosyltransferase involved in cell wall biosynthesis
MEDDPKYRGILQKMNGQINALKTQSIDVDYTTLTRKGILLNGALLQERNIKGQLSRYYYFYNAYFSDLLSIIQNGNYQVLYIRHFIATKYFIKFLKHTKKQWPKMQVLLEIPTFPYSYEYQSILQRMALLMDVKWKNHLHKYVDQIIHYGRDTQLWGIECIAINNGVEIPEEVHFSSKENDTTVFIGVGNLEYWWGLEDFINSFANYVKKGEKKIHLMVVGEGRLSKHLKLLIKDLNIGDWVTFTGSNFGQELEQLLRKSHIGIGTLAMEKKSLEMTSSLKHRLYASYGLPFIMKGNDSDFIDKEWVYGIEQGKKIVIQEILDWYDVISKDHTLQESVRNFAKSNLTWNTQFIPVINAIKDQ